MLDHVGAQVVAYLSGIPARSVQQSLDSVGSSLTDSLGELPSVAPLYRPEQAAQKASGSFSDLRTGETRGDARV
jgi:hypothetical protein